MADVSLESAFVLDAATIEGYRRNGHAVVRGLATAAEAAAFLPAIADAAVANAFDRRPLAERDTYGRAFLQTPNLWRLDPAVERFVRSPRFARVAAELMGVEGVRLYHDQALFKEPGGGHTPWHQDQNYWPLATDHTITMWMPLVDVDSDMGVMTFASGTHHLGNLGDYLIGDPSHAHFESYVHDEAPDLMSYAPLRAGDATFHAGWTLHSAGPNTTEVMRAVMTVIYFADGTVVSEVHGPAQEFDRRLWLGGYEPGRLADAPTNPLLYHCRQEE